MAQPQSRNCTRCAVTDLLDTRPPWACAVDAPCLVEFQLRNHPPPVCQIVPGATTGICTDPLAAAPVGIGGAGDGNAFRLVFSSLLDPGLDDVSRNAQGNLVPTLKSGIAEIDDAGGAPLRTTAFYDPTGAAVTSDALVEPFGPAIELDMQQQLAPNTTYTIKLDSTRIVDRLGRAATDSSGAALPPGYTLPFTTEASPAPRSMALTGADASK